MTRRLGSACLGALLSLSCASPKPAASPHDGISFSEGMKRLCNVDELAGLDPEDDPITIESTRYDWALANVEHPDVIELLTLMRVKSESERAEMLRSASSDAELSSCALADTLKRS